MAKRISEFEMIKQAQEKANKRKSAVVSPKSTYDPAIRNVWGDQLQRQNVNGAWLDMS